jgi:hypothetical protein
MPCPSGCTNVLQGFHASFPSSTFDFEHWEYGTTGGDPITPIVSPISRPLDAEE